MRQDIIQWKWVMW